MRTRPVGRLYPVLLAVGLGAAAPARADSKMVQSPLLERTCPCPDPAPSSVAPEARAPRPAARHPRRPLLLYARPRS